MINDDNAIDLIVAGDGQAAFFLALCHLGNKTVEKPTKREVRKRKIMSKIINSVTVFNLSP